MQALAILCEHCSNNHLKYTGRESNNEEHDRVYYINTDRIIDILDSCLAALLEYLDLEGCTLNKSGGRLPPFCSVYMHS